MSSALEILLRRSAAAFRPFALGTVSAGLGVAAVVMLGFAFAQGHTVITPSQLVWRPLIPGVEMAVVSGDPDRKGGLYVIRIRSKGQSATPLASERRARHGTGGIVPDGPGGTSTMRRS